MARSKEFDIEETLNKAMHLFWCKGYNACSMQEVVDTLELSRSSIYDTFTDKRTLYLETLKKYRRESAGAFIKMIEEADDVKELLRMALNAAAAESLSDPLHKGCYMVNAAIELAPHDPEIAEIVQSNMKNIEDALVAAIKKAQEAGQISGAHNPASLSRFFSNTVNGIRVAAKSGAGAQVYEDIIKVAMSVM